MKTIKDLRKMLNAMGISSWYAYNDKRKSFKRRLKIDVKRPLSEKELVIMSTFCEGNIEVSNYGSCLVVKF